MGGYEPNPLSWAEKSVPDNFHFSLLDSDYDHFEQIMNNALGRVPKLETAGIKELINGPESFTPDGNFILGESPELNNFFHIFCRRRTLRYLNVPVSYTHLTLPTRS